ncbi:hypothetical protein DRO02_07155 [archaeon]|nr:MAG: hypothetical protein DRO02_07155 [archaeon]
MKKLIPPLIVVVVIAGLLYGEDSNPPLPKLRRDIEISEVILEEVVLGTHTLEGFLSKVEGFYFPEKGLIFVVNVPLLLGTPAETLEARVKDFFCHYLIAFPYLDGNERIRVALRYEHPSFEGLLKEEEGPQVVVFSIEKADLDKYKSGKLTERALRDKIKVTEIRDLPRDVRVMGAILKETIDSPESMILYLPDDGAYFLYYGRGIRHILESLRSLRGRIELKVKKEVEHRIKAKERELIETLALYSGTLVSLKEHDYVNIGISMTREGPTFILQAKKGDLVKLGKKELTPEEFSKQIRRLHY